MHQVTVTHCLTGHCDHCDHSQSLQELECHNLPGGRMHHHGVFHTVSHPWAMSYTSLRPEYQGFNRMGNNKATKSDLYTGPGSQSNQGFLSHPLKSVSMTKHFSIT